MNLNGGYYYAFLEHQHLALVAGELEQSVYTSPRTMLTHARVLIDSVLQLVMKEEGIPDVQHKSLKERLDEVGRQGLLTDEVRDALHEIRMAGNRAAHQPRAFRVTESVAAWEQLYIVMKWYTEVYGNPDFIFPEYRDPALPEEQTFELPELESRLGRLEDLLRKTLSGEAREALPDQAREVVVPQAKPFDESPGYTTVRQICYGDRTLDVPYFLRDAFLLPQRFEKSVRFLVKLHGAEEARIMSELPADLVGLHLSVTRYTEKNDEQFFEELAEFIEEEKARRRIRIERPGELFLFHKGDSIVVTETLAGAELTKENFPSLTPGFIRQLEESGIRRAGQLPQELVILAKYKNVGAGTIEKLFEDLKNTQKEAASV
ncbi:type I restriction enzyme EcoKI subunit R [Bhargavaea cecembensis DSE10]|uniref:Type I restriction enzyme EcoKI subunit R n=1 Tax=Bhargavaea cecembensis DSE10 TaxID=1235279 RepID=M7NFM0_9BACL|nr:DUF4145 domain-containing protein [Bhargavaea cecembensis]EMR07338.1 type I restriction enzyme EcoKI subunit R [Bhargavaea cecembensis DSE10]